MERVAGAQPCRLRIDALAENRHRVLSAGDHSRARPVHGSNLDSIRQHVADLVLRGLHRDHPRPPRFVPIAPDRKTMEAVKAASFVVFSPYGTSAATVYEHDKSGLVRLWSAPFPAADDSHASSKLQTSRLSEK